MANNRWLGAAQVTSMAANITPTAANNETYIVTINGKEVSFTADGSATAQEIVEGLQPLLDASEEGEYLEADWTEDDSKVVATVKEGFAGRPVTITGSSTPATGKLAVATATANSGPEDFNLGDNWSDGIPNTGDDVYFDSGNVNCKWNLGALAGGDTMATLNVLGEYKGEIGLPVYNESGTKYREYRALYLSMRASTVNVGDANGGPKRFYLDSESAQTAVNVRNTDNSTDSLPAFLWKGTNASNAMRVEAGSVGVAVFGGETANLSGGLTVSGGSVLCGTGVTLSGVTQHGGNLDTSSALGGTTTQNGGNHIHRIGTVTALVLNGGTFDVRALAAMTITDLTVGPDGVLDLTNCVGAVTVTNTAVFRPGARIVDPNDRLTGSPFTFTAQGGLNSIDFVRSGASATVTLS